MEKIFENSIGTAYTVAYTCRCLTRKKYQITPQLIFKGQINEMKCMDATRFSDDFMFI